MCVRVSVLCVCVCTCDRGRQNTCVCSFSCVLCASMRGSLKRFFIPKRTVQGEMSDELFRDISHPRNKVFLEVRPLKGYVCVYISVCMCVCL